MGVSKIAITLEQGSVARLDQLVSQAVFPNRSRAIQSLIDESLARRDANRLAQACSQLDPAEEKTWAELGLGAEGSQWPDY